MIPVIKTVLTAAGKGTRLLPFTKEMPKEMMPIFTKIQDNQRAVIPLLQFIFDQHYSMKIRKNYMYQLLMQLIYQTRIDLLK